MNTHRLTTIGAIIVLAVACSTIYAQPKILQIGVNIQDMTANGQTVVGFIYDRPITEYAVVKYTRGGSVITIPDAFISGNGILKCNSDASVLSLSRDNLDDWGGLNCFDTNTDPPHTPPCPIASIAHRWTAGSGWVNCGSFDWTTQTLSYSCDGAPFEFVDVRVGGTRCDSDINTPYDISGDGRYVVGGGWHATAAARSNGCAPFGFCGDYYAWRYDSQTGDFEQLAVQPGTDTTRADRINGDGSVIVGYDLGTSPDPDGAGPLETYETRRLSVWRNGVQTLLDPYGHIGSPPVTSDGTKVAAQSSEILSEILYGPPANPEDNLYYTRLIRWTWNGATWAPESLGKPALYEGFPAIQMIVTSISDDGNTIIGSVGYGTQNFAPALLWRLFIWRPTINGGVPMDLQQYLQSQAQPGDTTFNEETMWIYDARHLSADGNAMVVTFRDMRSPCEVVFGNGILNLNPVPCTAPSVTLDAQGVVTTSETPIFGFEVLNARTTGSLPMTTKWQKKDLVTAEWVDIQDDNCEGTSQFQLKGTDTNRLLVGVWGCDEGSGDYRCVVTNACGTATSEPVHLTITEEGTIPFCGIVPGDMDGNQLVDAYDVPDFVASLLCLPFTGPVPADRADVNLDGLKDGLDVQAFVDAAFP